MTPHDDLTRRVTDDLAFLGIHAEPGATTASMPLHIGLCTSFDFLYGGSGLAACIAMAEHATGRPLVWTTVQFLVSPRVGDTLQLEVEVLAGGRATTQATVRATLDGRLALWAMTGHTVRAAEPAYEWGTPPRIAPPDACETFEIFPELQGKPSFMDRMDRRMDPSLDASSGHVPMWVRIPEWRSTSAAWLGFAADVVPIAINLGAGLPHGGTSLDNTLRAIAPDALPSAAEGMDAATRRLVDDGWVLMDIEAHGFRRSIGHGQVRLWRPDGLLLGVASQSAISRTSHHERA